MSNLKGALAPFLWLLLAIPAPFSYNSVILNQISQNMLAKSIYKIESVKNVYSADDIVLMLDLGHDGLYRITRCRLMGVDAPSTFNTESAEAHNLKTFVSKALNKSKEAYVEVVSYRNNSWLVNLFTKDPKTQAFVSLNQLLIRNGYVFNREATSNAE